MISMEDALHRVLEALAELRRAEDSGWQDRIDEAEDNLAEAYACLYAAHGCPLGPSETAIEVWSEFLVRTTLN